MRVDVADLPDGRAIYFFCPGCGQKHGVQVQQPGDRHHEGFRWNGCRHGPSVSPVMTFRGRHLCKGYLVNGQIQYLADSTHALAGQYVPLPHLE